MTLYLVLKAEWFDKIERGEKTHEYREKKPYWEKRIAKLLTSQDDDLFVILSRGYHKDARKLEGEISKIGVILDGMKTDLKINAEVYDIELRNVRRIA